ncbi:hypothetical protein PENSPDRAFT_678724 [Peniophora sp. CONT]|nr:hypothetical protein PENSPDRAFT_678724 [Peniophora sp. CONT]
MIARCRSKCWVVQLKEDGHDVELPHAQRGMKGNIIIYPQHPGDLADILPPSIEDIITPICVLFIGSSPPSQEWLLKHAKPLAVRREKVRAALEWLVVNNPLYEHVRIDHAVLDGLNDEQILPYHIQHIPNSAAQDSLTARYDGIDTLLDDATLTPETVESIPFQSVVITDVDGTACSNELRAAALKHVKEKGGAYIQIPHDPTPANEFNDPLLFPKIYPSLFPYGLAGFQDSSRLAALSMKQHTVDSRSIIPFSFPPLMLCSVMKCSFSPA